MYQKVKSGCKSFVELSKTMPGSSVMSSTCADNEMQSCNVIYAYGVREHMCLHCNPKRGENVLLRHLSLIVIGGITGHKVLVKV